MSVLKNIEAGFIFLACLFVSLHSIRNVRRMNCADLHYETLCSRLQGNLGKQCIMEVAAEAISDTSMLEALFRLMSEGNASLRWRAAWAVEKVSLMRPLLLTPWRGNIVGWVMSADVPDGFRRLSLSILYNLPAEEGLDVALFNSLLDRMVDLQSPPGVQALSMKLASRMSLVEASLHEEFLCILRSMELEYYSAGVKSVVRNCLKKKKGI